MSHSASLNLIQVQQYQSQLHGLSPAISRLTYRAAYAPFKPVIPDNACTLRITAAAGTELAGAYSDGTLKPRQVSVIVPIQKKFTTLSAFVLHAAWLDQASAHCPIFLTAASRRSRVRVSVPVWGAMLSHPLSIGALVGRYPAN